MSNLGGHVTIVGSGSARWLTAAILSAALNGRADTPFWRGVREDTVMPDRLAEYLELWRYKLPDHHAYPEQIHSEPAATQGIAFAFP